MLREAELARLMLFVQPALSPHQLSACLAQLRCAAAGGGGGGGGALAAADLRGALQARHESLAAMRGAAEATANRRSPTGAALNPALGWVLQDPTYLPAVPQASDDVMLGSLPA